MYTKLRDIRNKVNMPINLILETLGVNKSSYYKKEMGSVKFSLEEAKKIADLFNTTIDEIFFD